MLELYPYQKTGAEWLATKRFALLADEMGLGKSAQAIKAADLINAERILVLCPAVARINWIREFEKFSTRSRPLTLVSTRHSPLSEIQSRSLVVSSYDLVHSNVNSLRGPWDLLILDEAHYLKSIEAKRTKATLGNEGVVRQCQRVWALSGTPAPNHVGELWPILITFGAIREGFQAFIERYCNYIDTTYGRQITGTKIERAAELQKILSKVMMRRRKEDVLTELPPITFDKVYVEPSPVDLETQSSFIEWVLPVNRTSELMERIKSEEEFLTSVFKKMKPGTNAVATIQHISSSIATLRRFTGLQKVDEVAKLVSEELENKAYEKIVIFAIHRDVIEGLRVKLAKFGAVTLYGGTPPEKRQLNIDKFQKSPKTRVFIGNIQACGTAISLTAAHNVLFVEVDWVPGNNAQAAMRCHRIGQTKPVYVRFVSIPDSLDQQVMKLLRRKTRELTEIFDETGLQAVKTDAKQVEDDDGGDLKVLDIDALIS